MAKRGRKNSMKRIAAPKTIPIHDKKANTWITRPCAGAHKNRRSMALAVLLKDVLRVCKTRRETVKILSNRMVKVDGKIRTESKLPVGLMDVIGLEKAAKAYRLTLDRKGRLTPREITNEDSAKKIAKITNKHIGPGGKINITFHDGKNMTGDNHLRVGDSAILQLPEGRLQKHLKLEKGAHCLITDGKHAGIVAVLEELIPRDTGKPAEAKVKADKGEFVTVARYLFVVDREFRGVEE
jgi:small subunit ribosomal protein S4e